MSGLTLIGCYPLAEEPWHLVEMQATDLESPLDFGTLRLPEPLKDHGEWQVPYDERILDDDGLRELTTHAIYGQPRGTFRFCFFLYLDPAVSLSTPLGEIDLSRKSELPDRLAFVEFEEP